jgi:hypothetical protein
LTYSDCDTVVEGGTVAAPDVGAPLAQAAIDLTGLGSALASPAYSPYNDSAGVLNAFGGTALPVGALSEPSRAKVSGRPPQEQRTTAPTGPGGGASARLAEGPSAEATTRTAAIPGPDLTLRIGDLRAVVRRSGPAADSAVTVALRTVSIGDVLTFESITLSASATSDGGPGRATASSIVQGVAVAGRPVRLTPRGLEPAGAGAPDLAPLAAAGIEILSAGEATASPGAREAQARARGPRLRFRSSDGRILTLVLGEALASSTFVPPSGG